MKFADNVGVDRVEYVGPVNGSGMLWGEYQLRFTAHDKDKNHVSCIFTLQIICKSFMEFLVS